MTPIERAKSCVVLAALALAAGCSGKENETPEAVTARAGTGEGELVVLLPATITGGWPAGLDPATNATGGSNLSLMNAIFGGLFQLTADDDGRNARVIGVLASGYRIAEDGRSLTITLREGLRFSDGTPLNAAAVRFNIERNINAPCTCAPVRWPWAESGRVTTPDEHTVVLHFNRPYAAAINGLPISNLNWIASPVAIAKLGEEKFRITPVGAGPFKVVSNSLSTRLVLERNPLYWQEGRPYLNRLVFQSIGNDQAAYFSLLAGDAHVVESVSSTPLIEQARAEGKVVVTQQPSTSPYVIQLNTSVPPFNDKRAREAIYHATDVDAVIKGLFHGWYSPSQSFTGDGGLFHQPTIPGYRTYNVERASKLVKELGAVRVRLGTLQSFASEQVVTALQSQWRKAGIDVTMETYEFGGLIREFQSGKWQAMLQTAGSYDPEAASGVSFRFRSDVAFSGVHDPQLDKILNGAAAAVAPNDRESLYLAAAQRISDEAYAPFLFAFGPVQLTAPGVAGPGLTTKIPPVLLSTGVLWQDVRFVAE